MNSLRPLRESLRSTSYVSIYLNMPRTKAILVRGDFGGIFKMYSDLWALWSWKQNANWTIALQLITISSKCSIFRTEKFETRSATKKTKRTWKMATLVFAWISTLDVSLTNCLLALRKLNTGSLELLWNAIKLTLPILAVFTQEIKFLTVGLLISI